MDISANSLAIALLGIILGIIGIVISTVSVLLTNTCYQNDNQHKRYLIGQIGWLMRDIGYALEKDSWKQIFVKMEKIYQLLPHCVVGLTKQSTDTIDNVIITLGDCSDLIRSNDYTVTHINPISSETTKTPAQLFAEYVSFDNAYKFYLTQKDVLAPVEPANKRMEAKYGKTVMGLFNFRYICKFGCRPVPLENRTIDDYECFPRAQLDRAILKKEACINTLHRLSCVLSYTLPGDVPAIKYNSLLRQTLSNLFGSK